MSFQLRNINRLSSTGLHAVAPRRYMKGERRKRYRKVAKTSIRQSVGQEKHHVGAFHRDDQVFWLRARLLTPSLNVLQRNCGNL